MEEFDPFGWLEKYLPARIIHLLIRISIIAVLIVFLIHRISSYDLYIFKPLWVVETLIFIIFLIIYLIRKDPVNRSRGIKEIIVPLTGGMLPFALLFSPPNVLIAGNLIAIQIIFYWMTAATTLTVWGLWTLRRSFSITVEVRDFSNKRPLSLDQASDLFRRNSRDYGRYCLANFTTEYLYDYFVRCYPTAKSKMGGRQTGAGLSRLLYYTDQTNWLFPHNKK